MGKSWGSSSSSSKLPLLNGLCGLDKARYITVLWIIHNLLAVFYVFFVASDPGGDHIFFTFLFLGYGVAGYKFCVKPKSAPGDSKIGFLRVANIVVILLAAVRLGLTLEFADGDSEEDSEESTPSDDESSSHDGKPVFSTTFASRSSQTAFDILLIIVNSALGYMMYERQNELAGGTY